MCARIDNAFGLMMMREIGIGCIVAKGELQNLYAGQVELFAQCDHRGCNQAQVFSNQRQLSELLLQYFEQLCSGCGLPFTNAPILHFSRYSPVGFQPPKVINAHQMHAYELSTYAFNPPLKSV